MNCWVNCGLSKMLPSIVLLCGCLQALSLFGPRNAPAFAFRTTSKHASLHRLMSSLIDSDSVNRHSDSAWILLAEEDPSRRRKIGKYLASEGRYQVTAVADTKSALLICRGAVRPKQVSDVINSTKTVPDCLVLDANLPGSLDGLELLKVIRTDQLLKFMPIVLLTDRNRVDRYGAGADAHLAKPFDKNELLSVIDGLLKRGKRPSRLTDKSNNSSLISVEDLRQELADIKNLLVELGFNINDAQNSTASSIRGDLARIKESVIIGNKKVEPSEGYHDKDSNQRSEAMLDVDKTYPVFFPRKCDFSRITISPIVSRLINHLFQMKLQ